MRPSKKNLLASWIDVKAQIERLEKEKSELKEKLEKVLEKEPDQTLELNGWKCTLVESSRESFRLKEAKIELDLKVLKPFISISKFTQIRTTWQGGEVEAAA